MLKWLCLIIGEGRFYILCFFWCGCCRCCWLTH